jgi:ribosome-binding ATPase
MKNSCAAEDTPIAKIAAYVADKGLIAVEVSARIETEISRLDPEERTLLWKTLTWQNQDCSGWPGPLTRQLNLLSFFTVGEDEVRAWTVQQGSTARRAAGKIHSDIERGFIRAELFHYDHLFELGSAAKVREAGHFRLEGKDYLVRDGDIINFRFNV